MKQELECLGENIEKYITFSVPIKKVTMMMMVMTVKRRQSHTNYILLIVIDLRQANYQILLVTYQKFTIRNANHGWKEKK